MNTPINVAAGGFLSVDVIPSQISLGEDTFYGRAVFTIVFLQSTATPASPLALTWTNNARIGQLLDGNANQNWTLKTNIGFDAGGLPTKSPKSVSSALIQVMANRNNVVNLPSVAFDNLVNRWRIATTAESSLPVPVPPSPSVFSLNTNTGVVNFTPRTTGFYSVQFMLVSYDPATGIEKSTVPLDVLFQAITPTEFTSTLANTQGQSTFTATVGQPFSYTMRGTLSPNHPSYTTTINNTTLPPGAFTTGGSCTGTATCDKVFNWTPTVNSTGGVVCYTSTVTFGQTVIASASQQCITVNLDPLETRLTAYPTEGAAGGGNMVLSAKLERVFDSAPLAGRVVNFTFDANPSNPPWIGTASAFTDATGVARATVTTVGLVNPPSPYTATFSAIEGELLASSSSSALVSVKAATTSMGVPTFGPASIGYPLTATAKLNRIFTDGGVNAIGAAVQFTLSGPGGVNETATGVTNTTGIATVTFQTPLPGSGPYTVQAQFAGNDTLFPNADGSPTTASASVTATRRTQLSIQPLTAFVGEQKQVSVTLHQLPELTIPLGSSLVQLSGAGTALTNANGVATFNVTFPAEGSVALTATYTPTAGFANSSGLFTAESTSVNVPVTKPATQLSFNPTPVNATVGQPLVVNATLTRTSAPAAPVSGGTVVFTLRNSINAPVATQTVTTDSSGNAAATLNGISATGVYSLSVTYAGTSTLAPAAPLSSTITATVQTATSLAVAPFTAPSGQNTVISAVLTNSSGVALGGLPVTFTIVGGATLGTATTNGAGIASISVVAGNVFSGQYRADFAGTPGYAASSATASYVISPATTSVSVPTVAATNFVGDTITASATVTRTSIPAGAVAGETVSFTLTGAAGNPGGATSQIFNSTTNAAGVAQVTFPATARGQFTLSASYAGNGSLSASTSSAATTTVFQKTQLTLASSGGFAGASIGLTATLTSMPGNTPVDTSIPVRFDVGFLLPPYTSNDSFGGTTSNGVVTIFVPAQASGSINATARTEATDYFEAATSTQLTVTIEKVATSMANITATPTGSIGQPVAISTALTRTTAPSGVLAGQPVTFTITAPNGTTSAISATTDWAGIAMATFTPQDRGTYQTSASFAGSPIFQSSAAAPASTVVAQPTTLTLAPVVAIAGGQATLSATVTAVPQGTPVANETVTFSWNGGSMSAPTDASGVATVNITFPSAGLQPVSATLVAGNNYNSSSNSQSVVVEAAMASLSALSVPSTSLVGDSLVVATTLTRTSAPVSTVAGVSVTFTLESANAGLPQTLNAITDSNGTAQASFNLTGRGAFTVTAQFAGDSALIPSQVSAGTSVYQKTALVMNAANGIAGSPTQLAAQLFTLPDNAPLNNQAVEFSIAGNGTVSAVTGGNGLATGSLAFNTAGTFAATVAFNGLADYFVDANGNAVPSTASALVTIDRAATALDALTAPGSATVGNTLTVTTLLTRTSAPAGPAAGETVFFTVTGPDGSTTTHSGVAVTAANGVASYTFTPTIRGIHAISASFASTAGLDGSSASAVSVSVYQRTTLTLAPATGSATKPTTISATLRAVPSNTPLAGKPVAFSFTDGSWGTATTNAQGVAQVTLSFAAVGEYTSTATFTDAAGFYADSTGAFPVVATTGSGTVSVTNNPPTFTAPANIIAEATGATGSLIEYTAAGGDIEDGPIGAVCTPASNTIFALGTTLVNCTVTDAAGASAGGSFSVTVRDTTAPAVTAPASVSFGTNTGTTYVGAFGVATATDAVSNSAAISITSNAPAAFPIGTTTVIWTATDAAGNSATASHTVTVTDDDAPSITAPGAATFGTNTGATYVGAFGMATAADNASSGAGLVITNNAPAAFPIGTTTVIWTATDEAGNAISASQDVTVADDDAPSITAPAAANVGTNTGATYVGAIGLATATDNASSGAGLVVTNNAPASFPLGTTTVTWTATDEAGNSATATQDVTVADDDAPSITAPGAANFGTNTGATYTGAFGTATATDNVSSGAGLVITNNAPPTFPIGTTTVIWTATDEAGNASTSTQDVTVADDDAPSITAPGAATFGTNTGASYTGAIGLATATDNASSGAGLVITNNAPAAFPMGNTTVIWTATDEAGNATSATQVVTVIDDDAPVLTAPAALTVGTNTGGTYVGAIGAATATDNVSIGGGITITDNRPAAFPLGNTTVTFTAVDEAGNTTTATQVVTVVDDDAPVVTYTGNAGTYTVDQTVNIICSATDAGSGIASTTCANITGPAHTFAVGVNTRTATATDNAGNAASATVSFTVTVPPSAVGNVITQFFDSPAEAAKANHTLNQATSAPNANARAAHLNKLKKDIEKEIGKTLTAAEAATLISLLNNLY